MITKYVRKQTPPSEWIPTMVIVPVVDEDGNVFTKLIEEDPHMEQYGDYTDWSLSSMISAGISPESFSSPTVSLNRLEASEKLSSIDLSVLDTPTE